ncbi:MAG: 2-dehydro-3-deoxy-D-gluconate 5-dehydrogenase KduD [Bacteroidetes bacterium]|nr:2-dehydro-3-deoxy-D-gluconate 5-dehydrogenase KduD [Bacteroidota bacterium]MCW5894123.1 2-dehydro-3-deoxy-D-gluconate 5-dehydrogenase KduD [Bacteroidota bacterium]
MTSFDLKRRSAIVTGASTGLGNGIARALAAAGADILMVDRTPREAGIDEINEKGVRTVSLLADLSRKESIDEIVATAIREFGKIDILVNNAGIIRRAPAIDFSETDWEDVMNINAKAVFFLAQAAARDMMKRKYGKIINIASLLSFQGGIIVPSYAASKGAVAQVTKALANEWAQHGITVNAIAPGYMATNNTKALREDPVRSKAILDRIPAGRWGTPEDLQGAAVFLASPASDYVNGHVLVVDGGWLAR